MPSILWLLIIVFVAVLLAIGKKEPKTEKILRIDHRHYNTKDEYECPACGAVFRKNTMICPQCGVRFTGIRKDWTVFHEELDEELDLEEDLFDDDDN